MPKGLKKTSGKQLFILLPLFILGLWFQTGLTQNPGQERGEPPPVKLGEISFHVREFEASPSPIKLLEVQIEIFNPSPRSSVPPNSVKVIVTPKEIRFASPTFPNDFTPSAIETTFGPPLPPRTVRLIIIGFPMPKDPLESISFEVQINPPEGEKKAATYYF